MTKKRPSALSAVYVSVLLTAAACQGGGNSSPVAPADSRESSHEVIDNFRLEQTRGGKVVWELEAERAVFVTSDEVALTKPSLRIRRAEGGTSVVRAGRGTVIMSASEIKTHGPTVLTAPGKKVNASDITYDSSSDKISTQKSVKIVTEDSEITGDSMVSDSRLETITLSNQKVRYKQ